MKSYENDIAENLPPQEISAEQSASGVFTWVIQSDTFYADAAAAALFGFSAAETKSGLPRAAFRARIHPDDVVRFAEAVEDMLKTGVPFQEDYRVCRPDGTCVAVSGFGACFRDEHGTPLYCSGMMVASAGVPVEAEVLDEDEIAIDPLLHHCLLALEIARTRNDEDTITALSDALRSALVDAVPLTRH
ncbi:PAS domain-containing protein [Rhizobium sp. RU36D]|uniref:PAS domain-containing protein n=1 Tax=Rhizobium sp. RU36D TaxID=1907415 RepID=UPI0009D84597|nr:PAS domain-containing protein [Rhizobium sp. RU36D]SMC96793.1 PAS fold-containing protein [Rhizobium sp. RU36D]